MYEADAAPTAWLRRALRQADRTLHLAAIRASISIPGIAPPFQTDSGELLVDGAVLNGIPADVMHHPDDGVVIAVDVSPPVDLSVSAGQHARLSPWRTLWRTMRRSADAPRLPTIVDIMQRTAHLGAMQHAKGLRDRVDLYLEPPVSRYELSDWRALDALAEAGYHSTRSTLAAWNARQIFHQQASASLGSTQIPTQRSIDVSHSDRERRMKTFGMAALLTLLFGGLGQTVLPAQSKQETNRRTSKSTITASFPEGCCRRRSSPTEMASGQCRSPSSGRPISDAPTSTRYWSWRPQGLEAARTATWVCSSRPSWALVSSDSSVVTATCSS